MAHRLFVQQLDQADIKETTKIPYYLPLGGESTGDRWLPIKGGQ